MEQIISGLLRDFKAGKLTRRQLIQALALGVTAGPAALAVAQKPAQESSIPPPRSPAPWKTVLLDHISYVVSDYRPSTAFYRDLMGWEIIHDDGPEAVHDEGRRCGRHHHPQSRRIRGRRRRIEKGRPGFERSRNSGGFTGNSSPRQWPRLQPRLAVRRVSRNTSFSGNSGIFAACALFLRSKRLTSWVVQK